MFAKPCLVLGEKSEAMKAPDSRNIEVRARRMLYRKLGGYDFHRMRLYLRDMKDLMAYKKDKLKE